MTKEKKSIFELFQKSMAKSGGCCGAGETCGGSAEDEEKKATKTAKDINKTK